MRRLSLMASLVAVAVLAGCAGPVGTPDAGASSTASPTAVAPTPEAPPVVDTLAFSGSDVRALASEEAVQTAAFADGVDAVLGLITDAVGEPAVTEVGEQCAGAHTIYEWENLVLNDFVVNDYFVVSFGSPTTGAVSLEVTGGYSVGDDLSADLPRFAADDVSSRDGGDVYVAFDAVSRVTHGDYTSPVGAVGYLGDDATLSSVITPGEWSSFLC
jgi:hypothetical protein